MGDRRDRAASQRFWQESGVAGSSRVPVSLGKAETRTIFDQPIAESERASLVGRDGCDLESLAFDLDGAALLEA